MVQRIGTADSATPHPDPSGGQAPALHFLIPPSTIGLQFGTFRPWKAGIEVDWRAHPGSESGTCFRTNRPCWLAPAHQGMKIEALVGGSVLGVIGAAPGFRLPPELRLGGRTDECGGGGIQALLRLRSIIFVPMTTCGLRTVEMALVY